jgi:hemolysin III
MHSREPHSLAEGDEQTAESSASAAPERLSRVPRSEQFSVYSHLFGAVAAAIGTALLAIGSRDASLLVVSLMYGLSMVFMFSASASYHAFKQTEDSASFLRRLDHLAIFFMIAGSYTPICWLHLEGGWRWSILGVQWGLVVLGLIFKIFFIGAPRVATAAIYLVMGWIAVIPFRQLQASMDSTDINLIFAGGLAYSIGAVCYALKRPNPVPGFFGFHEIFHVFVVLGALLHYIAIYGMVV